MRYLLTLVIAFGSFGVSQIQALTYASWVGCLAVPGSDCPLDSSSTPYPNVLGLQVANGVTIRGTGASPYSTTLMRTENATGIMIYVPPGATVTIRNLTIDGNRYSFPNSDHQTGCGPMENLPCGPYSGVGCARPNWGVNDVYVAGSATVDQVYFWNSIDNSLFLNDGTVMNSGFYYARSTGAFLFSGNAMVNSFDHNGTAGINLKGTGPKTVRNNVFSQNRYEIPDGVSGGQIYVDYNATNANIYDNTIDGYSWTTTSSLINGCSPPPSPQGPVGIEVEPYSSNNKIHGNGITRNPFNGIESHSVSGLEISGYLKDICGSCYPRYIENNVSVGGVGAGKGIADQWPGIPWPYSAGFTLDRVLSRNNSGYGVSMELQTGGTGWLGNHCVLPNYSTSNAFPLATRFPASTTTCP